MSRSSTGSADRFPRPPIRGGRVGTSRRRNMREPVKPLREPVGTSGNRSREPVRSRLSREPVREPVASRRRNAWCSPTMWAGVGLQSTLLPGRLEVRARFGQSGRKNMRTVSGT
jgi:hypothetical protein